MTLTSGEGDGTQEISLERVDKGVYTLWLYLMGMSDWRYMRTDERLL